MDPNLVGSRTFFWSVGSKYGMISKTGSGKNHSGSEMNHSGSTKGTGIRHYGLKLFFKRCNFYCQIFLGPKVVKFGGDYIFLYQKRSTVLLIPFYVRHFTGNVWGCIRIRLEGKIRIQNALIGRIRIRMNHSGSATLAKDVKDK